MEKKNLLADFIRLQNRFLMFNLGEIDCCKGEVLAASLFIFWLT